MRVRIARPTGGMRGGVAATQADSNTRYCSPAISQNYCVAVSAYLITRSRSHLLPTCEGTRMHAANDISIRGARWSQLWPMKRRRGLAGSATRQDFLNPGPIDVGLDALHPPTATCAPAPCKPSTDTHRARVRTSGRGASQHEDTHCRRNSATSRRRLASHRPTPGSILRGMTGHAVGVRRESPVRAR